MENNERDRKLDQWLDEALSEYGAAEPRFGLEQRVLNRISAEERARSRKWNVWRWMPAFAAIAAIIVVAVAVRPMLEKKPLHEKAPAQRVKAPMDAYLIPSEQKGAADKATRPKPASPTRNDERRVDAAELARKSAVMPHEEAQRQPRSGDHDAISAATTQLESPDSRQSYANEAPATNGTVATYNAPAAPTAAVVPPPPPPPPPPPESVTDKDTVTADATAPAVEAPQSTAHADEPPAPNGIVGVETLTKRTLAAMEPKDRKNRREGAKARADRENANVIDAFGVRVRIMNGLTAGAQQFPTPTPLSKQEKLALAAGRALQESAITQQKAVDIPPIEIKSVEIKPLEGSDKEK